MHMLKQHSTSVDANFKLPNDLSPQLRDLLMGLSSCERTRYLLDEVFSKFVSKETDPAIVRKNRAVAKWLATERENEATNDRLATIDPGYQILPRVSFDVFMSRVQSVVTDVIGEVVPEGALLGVFSSGASTSRRRTSSHASGKYIGKADVTKSALELAYLSIGESELWSSFQGPPNWRIVDSNVLFTVPKKTDIDRCACKEPDVNMYLQKGAGNFIRNCLRRVGINLNDQSRNQSLARIGSRDGTLATLDLSSASDSVCREFVFQALPIAWFTHLDAIRCHTTVLPDGEVHVNEMFSSMGNGFTFELESLLFYAVAKAVAWSTGVSGTISVYGDDIIVPSQMYQDLSWALGVVGFSVNAKKSFADGPFRESCGGHFISGSCVTPFYIRKPIDSLHDLIVVANAVRKWAYVGDIAFSTPFENSILDCELWPVWKLLTDSIPKCFWGGYDLEDSTRLVSLWKPDKPKRLNPIAPRKDTGLGGYLFWHNLKELAPMAPAIEASSVASFTGRFRSDKVSWDYRVTGRVFLDELTETDSRLQ